MDKAVVSDFSWFDLSNYSFIEGLSVYDFIHEIEWRHTLFYCSDNVGHLDDVSFEDGIKYKRIFRGDPNVSVDSEEEISFNKEMDEYLRSSGKGDALNRDKPSLKHDTGVMPLSFSELAMYNKVAIDQGAYFVNKDGELEELNPQYMLATVSKNVPEYFNHRILLDLWLAEATDNEILSSIKKLLPEWRRELSVPEPDILPRRRMGLKTIQKLIQNRVLPILDILLWGELNNKEVSNAILSHVVFQDDPKDSQVIKETIRPYALEAMGEPYTRLLRLFVDNDGEIGTSKIADVTQRIS
ncbi:TPA_asm: hypothetical protein G4L33_001154 [Salmonella enterica subsp. enterica serovar Madelia]|nr:hypothetical protein [Salmonella enterica subsp. enterica serovar Madelia]HAE6911322.1 hypothetical protein [Salmonella enterica subsp. enterica serovar Madelia]